MREEGLPDLPVGNSILPRETVAAVGLGNDKPQGGRRARWPQGRALLVWGCTLGCKQGLRLQGPPAAPFPSSSLPQSTG